MDREVKIYLFKKFKLSNSSQYFTQKPIKHTTLPLLLRYKNPKQSRVLFLVYYIILSISAQFVWNQWLTTILAESVQTRLRERQKKGTSRECSVPRTSSPSPSATGHPNQPHVVEAATCKGANQREIMLIMFKSCLGSAAEAAAALSARFCRLSCVCPLISQQRERSLAGVRNLTNNEDLVL